MTTKPAMTKAREKPEPRKKAPRGPGRPRVRSVEEGRALVLKAARRVFADRGFDASMDAIARQAGVPRTTVYELFSDRDALLHATVEDAADLMFRSLAAGFTVPNDLSWQEVVRHAYATTFQLVAEHPDALTVLFLAESSGAFPGSGMAGARQRVIKALAEQSRARWELLGVHLGPSADVMALMLYGMAENIARGQVEGRWDPEVLIDLLTRFTTGGFIALWNSELRELRLLDAPPPPKKG